MKLSMWILADWLWKYNPIIFIKNGEQVLRGVRLFTPDSTMEHQNVYLGRAQDFIGSGGDGVICVHEHDMMLLDTNDMDLVINEIFTAFDFYYKWADGLKDAVRQNCTMQEIIDRSYPLFNESIIVCDSVYKISATSRNYDSDIFKNELNKIISERQNSFSKFTNLKSGIQKNAKFKNSYIATFSDFNYRLMLANIFNFKKFLGQVIILETKHKITEGRLQLCATLGDIIEYWIRYNSEQISLRAEASIFRDLLERKSIAKEDALHHMNQIGWKETDEKVIVKIHHSNASTSVLIKQINSIGQSVPDCYLLIFEFSIVLVANLRLTPYNALIEQLNLLVNKLPYCCGVSNSFTDIMLFRKYYNQAGIALKYGENKEERIRYSIDYMLDYVIDLINTSSSTIIIHPAVSKLKEYDSSNKSELYHTLYEYLSHERNLVKTAEVLNIHRNSLLYRLKKIREIADDDFNDAKIRQYLLLSFDLDMNT